MKSMVFWEYNAVHNYMRSNFIFALICSQACDQSTGKVIYLHVA